MEARNLSYKKDTLSWLNTMKREINFGKPCHQKKNSLQVHSHFKVMPQLVQLVHLFNQKQNTKSCPLCLGRQPELP